MRYERAYYGLPGNSREAFFVSGGAVQQAIIKRLMKIREREIAFDPQDGAIYQELFDHPSFAALDDDEQVELGLQWARKLYENEKERPLFERCFPDLDLAAHLVNPTMLDLGCYVGGKTVRWLERYGGTEIHGIDVDERFIRIATAFAEEKNANARFRLMYAEDLNFPDGFFDVMFSENTFEHVRDIRKVMGECRRVLKPGGFLAVIFPSFWGPVSHHLNLVTETPFLHWFFSYPALLESYFSVMDERGESATWYRRKDERALPFERGYSINGTGAMEFHRMIKGQWHIVRDGFRERARRRTSAKRVLEMFMKTSRLPVFRELFGIAYVLQKR